jgi:UDP-glucose 4-epimerase
MRFFNTIGPRQTGRYGMVVPRLVRRALQNEPLEVYGDGEQSRCFADVCDTVKAITSLVQHPAAVGEVFNVGSTEEVSINRLAELVIELTGSRSTIRRIPYDEAYAPGFEDMRRRVPAIDKLHRLTGYTPEYTLRMSLERVIEYEKVRIKS